MKALLEPTAIRDRRSELLWRSLLTALAVLLPYLAVWGQLGLYWDDFYFLSIMELRGREGLIQTLSYDRPFLGVLWWEIYRMIGTGLWNYHLIMIALRVLLALTIAALVDELQPQAGWAGTAAALLAAAYPDFRSTPSRLSIRT
jgi:hypothetical protein